MSGETPIFYVMIWSRHATETSLILKAGGCFGGTNGSIFYAQDFGRP